jgi:pimeloyl-ACP methyl ester carboxylesterase
MYPILRPSRSEFLPIRSHTYHLRHWGHPQPGSPTLVLVHGWMDVSASWQFMVDAMADTALATRHIVAPDWRGFGLSRQSHVRSDRPSHYGDADHYWFADYLADLDLLISTLHTREGLPADTPIDLVGHSMGGNVAMLYAGIRPQRIRRMVNLEGFGMPATRPSQAPGRYAQWLDTLASMRNGGQGLKTYDSVDGVVHRLMKTNPRLGADKAQWLAHHWAAPNAQGRWEILGDPAHKVMHAQLYRTEEVLAIWQRITAPVLAVESTHDSLAQWFTQGQYTMAEYHQRLQVIPDCRIEAIAEAGHMLHHDQPQRLAACLETFLA